MQRPASPGDGTTSKGQVHLRQDSETARWLPPVERLIVTDVDLFRFSPLNEFDVETLRLVNEGNGVERPKGKPTSFGRFVMRALGGLVLLRNLFLQFLRDGQVIIATCCRQAAFAE